MSIKSVDFFLKILYIYYKRKWRNMFFNYFNVFDIPPLRKEMNDMPSVELPEESLEIFEKKWNELFGTMWDGVLRESPELGGFLIDKKTRQVRLDQNAMKLAEIDEPPDYDSMISYLDILNSETKKFAMLAPVACSEDDRFIAGILRWHYDFSGAQAKDKVPIYEIQQIESMMNKDPDKGVLALVEFVMSDRSKALKEAQVFGVLAVLNESVAEEIYVAASYPMCYWVYVPDCKETAEELLYKFRKNVRESGHGAVLGGSEQRYVTIHAGIGLSTGRAADRMASAEYALYEALMAGSKTNGDGVIKYYSEESFRYNKEEYEKLAKFYKLIRENLFIYHFQPIVSAKDGEIIAYEMLMRSTEEIGMFPLDILDCAEKTDRLYDIEKATISNALSIISKNQALFKEKKLFVNAITSHMLSDIDWQSLVDRYGELMERMVIEFTEQTELGDADFERFKRRLGASNIKIAIDDYGTGYSNTSNLIRYAPNVVKIDRSLITGIHTKPSLRKLVAGMIQFIHENGYQALAEGVETFEELKTMIQLGSDLIQGYYTARPKPIFLEHVSDEVKAHISSIDISDSTLSFYHPKEGERVELETLSKENYKALFIEKSVREVRVVGRPDKVYEMNVKIEQDADVVINIENVRLRSEAEGQLIEVRDDANVTLKCYCENTLDGHGVFVPRKSSLTIKGADDGSSCGLTVISNSEDCYAIGCPEDNSHGQIVIDMGENGALYVTANGDKAVGIGGGKNEESRPIQILSGLADIHISGGSCVGVGTRDGNAIIDVHDSKLKVTATAPQAIAVGSIKELTDIELKNSEVSMELAGINIAGIGSIENGSGKIIMLKNTVDALIKGRNVNLIGTREGKCNVHLKENRLKFYSEGGSVCGVGDMYGEGDVTLDGNVFDFDMRTGEGEAYCSRKGKVVMMNESPEDSIRINA